MKNKIGGLNAVLGIPLLELLGLWEQLTLCTHDEHRSFEAYASRLTSAMEETLQDAAGVNSGRAFAALVETIRLFEQEHLNEYTFRIEGLPVAKAAARSDELHRFARWRVEAKRRRPSRKR